MPAPTSTRPLSVTLIGCVYILAGGVGFVYHLPDFRSQDTTPLSWVSIELIRLVAIVAGVFLLRGHNWARWTAVGWMGFHVILSAFHSLPELVMHSVLFVTIALLLFRHDSSRYYR